MAWDFSTDPEFQKKLDWVDQFCKEKVEPLEFVFPYAVRSPDPVVKAYVRELQQEVKDQGLWAIFLDEELGGPGYGQLKLGLLNEVIGRYGYLNDYEALVEGEADTPWEILACHPVTLSMSIVDRTWKKSTDATLEVIAVPDPADSTAPCP